jgi:hypothetical protein
MNLTYKKDIDRLEYNHELEDATTSSSWGRVVWKRQPTINTHTLDVVGLAKDSKEYPSLRAIHVGDDEFWFKQLSNDYGRDDKAWSIDIYPVEGDYYTDDPQYAIPDEYGNKGDSQILITKRKVLKEGVDFDYGREFTSKDLEEEGGYEEDDGIREIDAPMNLSRVKKEAERYKPNPVTVTDPNGHKHTFPNEAMASAFRVAAGLEEEVYANTAAD